MLGRYASRVPGPPTTPPIGLVLTRTAKIVSRAFDETLAAAGGSLPTWLVLLALHAQPGASQRELAASVGIRGATLTHHLNAMEAAGLVSRRRDPTNRRVHVVELTPDGERLFAALRGAAIAFDRRLRSGLDGDALTTLEQLLGSLAENAAGEPIDAATV